MKLRNVLLGYRSTPTTTTGQTPSELFLGRRIRTRIDMVKPNLSEKMNNYNSKMEMNRVNRDVVRNFYRGDKVLVRNSFKKPKWLSGTIVEKISDRTYMIEVGERMLKRHIDHIIPSNGEVTIQKKPNDDTWYFNADNKTDNNIQLPLKSKPSTKNLSPSQ